MPDNAARMAAVLLSAALLVPVLASCSAGAAPVGVPSESSSSTPHPSATPVSETQPSAASTPTAAPTPSPKQAEYEAAIASWPEPLPPGYSWPAWTDLPHTEPYGVGSLARADNAHGVYRCILIDAAWHAYFETNDPVTSKDYATHADAYVIPRRVPRSRSASPRSRSWRLHSSPCIQDAVHVGRFPVSRNDVSSRARIVQSALECFAQHRHPQATVREIAARGASVGDRS